MDMIKISNTTEYVRDSSNRAVIMKDRSQLDHYNNKKEAARKKALEEKALRHQLNTLSEEVAKLAKIVATIKS